jgi:hypothetical protein
VFDQVMKRSNWVWIYKMGRFAEERRVFLSDLNEQGHSMHTLRNVNRFLLGIAERINVRRPTEIAEVQIVRAARDWVAKSCAPRQPQPPKMLVVSFISLELPADSAGRSAPASTISANLRT